MKIANFDFQLCRRPEKEVCEGLCLSFDLLSGRCMDSGEACEALLRQGEGEEGASTADPAEKL